MIATYDLNVASHLTLEGETMSKDAVEACGLLTEEEVRKFQPILHRFLNDYVNKQEGVSNEEWLTRSYQRELNVSEEEAKRLSKETIADVELFDEKRASLDRVCANGTNKEVWFSQQVSEAAVGMSINNYGYYLEYIHRTLENANAQMFRVLTTKDGAVNQCFNLDGFIAEQQHVNSFNMHAALKGSPYQAKVCTPGPGQTYGKNSFDIVIQSSLTKEIVHQYQCVFGKTAENTIQMIKRGMYNNQRLVVPKGQVEAVQKAFPGKSVSDVIGGTQKVSIVSEPLTKAQVKAKQIQAQLYGKELVVGWNNYTTKSLAMELGSQAVLGGISCAVVTTGVDLAKRCFKGEEFDAEKTIVLAIDSGADSGLKAAATGALKVSAEKGTFGLLPQGTPIRVLATTACMGVETVKAFYKVHKGEITIINAMEHLARTGCATYAGLTAGTFGTVAGAMACSFVPVVGPVLGSVVGGLLGYAAGAKVGNAVYSAAEKVAEVAKETVKSAWEGAKSVASTVYSGVKSIASAIFNW